MYAGFGVQSTFLWIAAKKLDFWTEAHSVGMSPSHVAFNARDRATVDAFYVAGIAAGARDNGPPESRLPLAGLSSEHQGVVRAAYGFKSNTELVVSLTRNCW